MASTACTMRVGMTESGTCRRFSRAVRINDVSSGASHYASSFSYAAHGGVTDVKLGNNLWEHTTFEPNRLQPMEIDLGTSQGGFDKLKLNYD